MLSISTKDEKDVQEFHKLIPDVGQAGFDRFFRSPTIFEDAVTSILLCNCTYVYTTIPLSLSHIYIYMYIYIVRDDMQLGWTGGEEL